METVSENSRGRGRPRAFTEEEWVALENGSTTSLHELSYWFSERGKQNIIYAHRAAKRIEAKKGEQAAEDMPRTVLTELGRIEDDEAFWRAVGWYEEEGRGMRAKDAAAAIRRMRTGKSLPASSSGLYRQLAGTVNAYRRQHPDVTSKQETDALYHLLRVVGEE